ncbi:MAG TPA: hypothetical protein VHA74_02245, partial [Candidatus Dojkabacteria bacterium]|nr:hypothetical protein [Candidatus Dojkabacteria bacterium]
MTNIDNLDYSEDLKNIIKKGRESYPYLSGQEVANETFGTQNRIFVGFTCIQDVEKRQTMWG